MRPGGPHRCGYITTDHHTVMIIDQARETAREVFEHLHETATPEQHELLVALERYVDMLHNIIDER